MTQSASPTYPSDSPGGPRSTAGGDHAPGAHGTIILPDGREVRVAPGQSIHWKDMLTPSPSEQGDRSEGAPTEMDVGTRSASPADSRDLEPADMSRFPDAPIRGRSDKASGMFSLFER